MSEWTVKVEKKGRLPGPTKYLWTLYEGNSQVARWWGCSRWTCRAGARARRRQIERERRVRDVRSYKL